MRKFLFVIFLVSAIACNKDDDPDKFTSIQGYWIVRTPDNLTEITFRIAVNSDNEQVVDAVSMKHNGSDYNKAPIGAEIALLSPTEIEYISFRTNDFVIRFWTISVNADFTTMEIANSSFVIDQNFREFSMINASRN
ncbi:MAG: hypothetical protein WA874_05675 [Chryseosolibacter sp.]